MSKPESVDLSGFTEAQLLDELLSRGPDKLRETEGPFEGRLTRKAFDLAALLNASRRCVDGVPVRRNDDGDIELMAIVRNTGKEIGKLCCVGGGVDLVKNPSFTNENGEALWVPQTNTEALKGHFRTDLGWGVELLTSEDEPQYFAQDMKPAANGGIKPGTLPNPNENAHAPRYLVQITEGDPDNPTYGVGIGGQEANNIEWFTEAEMPHPWEFGYNHGLTYVKMFDAAKKLEALIT